MRLLPQRLSGKGRARAAALAAEQQELSCLPQGEPGRIRVVVQGGKRRQTAQCQHAVPLLMHPQEVKARHVDKRKMGGDDDVPRRDTAAVGEDHVAVHGLRGGVCPDRDSGGRGGQKAQRIQDGLLLQTQHPADGKRQLGGRRCGHGQSDRLGGRPFLRQSGPVAAGVEAVLPPLPAAVDAAVLCGRCIVLHRAQHGRSIESGALPAEHAQHPCIAQPVQRRDLGGRAAGDSAGRLPGLHDRDPDSAPAQRPRGQKPRQAAADDDGLLGGVARQRLPLRESGGLPDGIHENAPFLRR